MNTKAKMASQNFPLTPQRIFQAALKLLDEQGLDALNMRAVASTLHVKAASLYNHVPNKSALLDGVQALVFAEVKAPSKRLSWSEHLMRLAHAWRSVLKKHPHATLLFASRPSVFSTALVQAETSLHLLTMAGFSPIEALYLFQSVAVFVLGHALAEMDPQGLEQKEPLSHEETLPFSKEKFPLFFTLAQDGLHSTDDWFLFGLRWLLQGAEVHLHKHTKGNSHA